MLQHEESKSCNKLRLMGVASLMSVRKPGVRDLTPLMRDRSLVKAAHGLPVRRAGVNVSESSEDESEGTKRQAEGTLMEERSRLWLIRSPTFDNLVDTRHLSLDRW